MGMIMRLFQIEQNVLNIIIKDTTALLEVNVKDDRCNMVDIDKSWGVLGYVFSKLASEDVYDIIKSTQSIDIEEMVSDLSIYYLNNKQVEKISYIVSKLDDCNFVKNLDFDDMNRKNIYGFPFDKSENCYAYFTHNFNIMKDFYKTANKNNKGVLMYVL